MKVTEWKRRLFGICQWNGKSSKKTNTYPAENSPQIQQSLGYLEENVLNHWCVYSA